VNITSVDSESTLNAGLKQVVMMDKSNTKNRVMYKLKCRYQIKLSNRFEMLENPLEKYV
jgi:hypothetical protein